jgi:hypothetical protein
MTQGVDEQVHLADCVRQLAALAAEV